MGVFPAYFASAFPTAYIVRRASLWVGQRILTWREKPQCAWHCGSLIHFTSFNLLNLHNKSVRQSYSHFTEKETETKVRVTWGCIYKPASQADPWTKASFPLVPIESLRCARLFATAWTVAHQTSLSVEFPRQECWSGLPVPPPGSSLTLWFTFPLLKLCYFWCF